jgi:hypothetical protein
LAFGLTIAIFLFFFIPWFGSSPFYGRTNEGGVNVILGLLWFPFKNPEGLSQTLLLSSLPVGVLATFKFVMAAALTRSNETASSAMKRSPLALLLAGFFSVLQVAGSVASILGLLRR